MYKLLGYKSFTGKNSKNWTILYLGYSDISVYGMCTKDLFIPYELLPSDVCIGDNLDIYLDLNNRVSKISISD